MASSKKSDDKEKIAIVGGGITGLFCAHILAQNNKSVDLFESSKRLGGRIRTIRLDNNNRELGKDQWGKSNLDFYAEFGPMRIELDIQLLLKALLDYLDIKPKVPGVDPTGPHLVDFPPFTSPSSASDPQFDLRPDEIEKDPLELMRLAFLRIFLRLDLEGGNGLSRDFNVKIENLHRTVKLAAYTQERVDLIFAKWMKTLNDNDYWDIQTRGRILADPVMTDPVLGIEQAVPLYKIGFWNLLSDYLSHNAISKIRDLGTFYHLIPDNPNAAEWFTWWLRAFAISENLQGIFGGMECIVERLEDKLKEENVIPNLGCNVTSLKPSKEIGKIELCFGGLGSEKRDSSNPYDRVILAVPKCALERIVIKSPELFDSKAVAPGDKKKPEDKKKTDPMTLLDSAFGFPMVKAFMVVKSRWWEKESANRYATRVPTRELHFTNGKIKDSKQGMIMLYTDRPASAFWANYVPPGEQADAYRPEKNELPKDIECRLKKKWVQYINENQVPEITDRDLIWYGIWDWRRKPYGGANHAWRPERKYWVVMRRLSDIGGAAKPAAAKKTPRIHICGEAYSDYHGFMEGSLRSAVYVLHRILDPADPTKSLSWLKGDGKTKIGVKPEYLEHLRKWAKYLDDIPSSENFADGYVVEPTSCHV